MRQYRSNPDFRRYMIDKAKDRAHRRKAGGRTQAEVITISALMVRDGDRCYLCGRQVSDDVPFNHPLKANVEHVVPLSRGGSHDWGNVKVACMSCNVRKHAKVAA